MKADRDNAQEGLTSRPRKRNKMGALLAWVIFLPVFPSIPSLTTASEYWWTLSGQGTSYRGPFPSLDSACEYVYQFSREIEAGYGGTILEEKPEYQPIHETAGWCYFGFKSKRIDHQGREYILNRINSGMGQVAARYGDTCPSGQSLNLTKNSCGNDEEKGLVSFCDVTGGSGSKKGVAEGSGFAGNPINFKIGNKVQFESDYKPAQSSLEFYRYYNSLDGLWRHSYSTSLRLTSFAVAVVRADGRETVFKYNGNTITAPTDELGKLEKNGATWVYSSVSNEVFRFDYKGRLIRREFPEGYQELSYNSTDIRVTDHRGQTLSLTVRPDGQPVELRVADLRVAYSYSPDNLLTQVTRTLGSQRQLRRYHYESPQNHKLLTGITDERGIRYASWTYDDQGRAISSEHADGADKVTVAYHNDGTVSVTNELGKVAKYSFQSIRGVRRITAIEGEPSPNCPSSNSSFTYDDRGLLKTKTDNKGILTTYAYNERGLEVSRTEASGTPQARTITTTWLAYKPRPANWGARL